MLRLSLPYQTSVKRKDLSSLSLFLQGYKEDQIFKDSVISLELETMNVTGGRVFIRKYVQIGGNSTVFPDIEIGEGAVVGACSLVNHNLEPWSIYYGIPAVKHKERNKGLLKYVNNDY